jgi:ATP-dependent Clp protease protease subunit
MPKTLPELVMNLATRSRQIFLTGSIDDETARAVIAQLLFLEEESPGTPIRLHINSGGGKVQAGLAIHDIMQVITSPVHTLCLGHCESMAAVLLASGEAGERAAMANARVMIHQPVRRAGASNNARQMSIHARSIENSRMRLAQLLASRTGKSLAEIEEIIEYDHVCNAAEARSLGLIDRVVQPGELTAGTSASGSPARTPIAPGTSPESEPEPRAEYDKTAAAPSPAPASASPPA